MADSPSPPRPTIEIVLIRAEDIVVGDVVKNTEKRWVRVLRVFVTRYDEVQLTLHERALGPELQYNPLDLVEIQQEASRG